MENPQSAIRNPQFNASHARRIIYIEPFSGISGDMMLGALLDLGADFERLRAQLSLLPVEGYHLAVAKCMRAGIHASKFDVHIDHAAEHHGHLHGPSPSHSAHHHRSFRDIRAMIQASGLSAWVKEQSIGAFRRLAEAEGKIHNQPVEKVHFHEIGAVDSIVDIVGAMIALEEFLPARLLSSAVNVGHGTLECQHGIYPVPGPAAQELLKGIPTFSNAISGELTTPTGATLLASLVEGFGPRPPMKIQGSGYGAGTRDVPGSANVLRVTLGEEFAETPAVSPEEQVAVIETTIDDMSPQVYGYFQEKALAAGALEVYCAPVQMKKNRPALLVTLICPESLLGSLSRLIFEETTTIGIRQTIARRKTLQREFVQVRTRYGMVTIKVSRLDGRKMNAAPEYEDCRSIAVEQKVALKEVIAAALHAYMAADDPSHSVAKG